MIHSADHSLIVIHSHIALDQSAEYVGVQLTKIQVLVMVINIFIPEYLISGNLLFSKTDTPLSKFSPLLFNLICKVKQIFIQTLDIPIFSASAIVPKVITQLSPAATSSDANLNISDLNSDLEASYS